MSKRNANPAIRLRGVRHNNLKNFDLDLPLGRLIVITGLSGSGKSSLAFDTLFAEGQRRYIETFSPYARQFFDRMDKPQVDRIEGIPPAIAIEQRNAVKTTRSTVGTMTELCDYMKLLWPHLAQLYCRQCGQLVREDSPRFVWESVQAAAESSNQHAEVLVGFTVPLSEKLSLAESLALIGRQGYQRLLCEKQVIRLEDALERLRGKSPSQLHVVQDRIKLTSQNRARFVEACEQAYHFGKGRLSIHWLSDSFAVGREQRFSSHFHCAACDLEYREPSTALFSFNHPIGACRACRGFGRIITIDYNLALPDRSRTLAQGAVKPWQSGMSAECQDDLLRMCRKLEIPTDVPFERLPPKWQDWVINGDPDYGTDEDHEWPRAWYGIKGYFRWLESRAYKMHVRVLLSRYRAYSTCPECRGRRFQPESLLYQLPAEPARAARVQAGDPAALANASAWPKLTLADFYQMPVQDALRYIEQLAAELASANGRRARRSQSEAMRLILQEVRARLGYLVEVGLGYLTLDRPTRSLSGGETERVNLTTCLGTRLVNTLFVLDEPTVGLHPRDTARLVRILENLRDAGNTVVVVEHEPAVIRAADQVVDLGPGSGEAGGRVIFQGPLPALLRCPSSLTGQYLGGAKQIDIPQRRPVSRMTPRLSLAGASKHNLKNLAVEIPLGRFICLTGVSGSGKTTLAREVLLPALQAKLNAARRPVPAGPAVARETPGEDQSGNGHDELDHLPNGGPELSALQGWQSLERVVLVDQSPLGKTPRSTPAVYIGAFDFIREVFAQTELAQQRGLNASAFSFNSAQGQCERCRGAGFEKIEMQFLSDVFIRCPDCHGGRYRQHILEVKLKSSVDSAPATEWSIADFLQATVDEAVPVLMQHFDAPAARRAVQGLKLLQEVGLGYLRLGQPINTLSGGESQRLKLVSHLAEFAAAASSPGPTLFLFDEPTTGLHFDDVRVLLKVFQRLVEAGHSLLVIEHNLEVIKSADWIIDLGPEAGDAGGKVVIAGAPEQVADCAASHTGEALKQQLAPFRSAELATPRFPPAAVR